MDGIIIFFLLNTFLRQWELWTYINILQTSTTSTQPLLIHLTIYYHIYLYVQSTNRPLRRKLKLTQQILCFTLCIFSLKFIKSLEDDKYGHKSIKETWCYVFWFQFLSFQLFLNNMIYPNCKTFPWTNKCYSGLSTNFYFQPFKASRIHITKLTFINFPLKWEILSFQDFMFVSIYGL